MPILERFEHQIFYSTKRIVNHGRITGNSSLGTGFVVSVPRANGRHCLLLVTNRHVIPEGENSIDLVMHLADESGQPRATEFRNIEFQLTENILFLPQNPIIDLAAINITALFARGDIYTKWIDLSMIQAINQGDLHPGQDVTFIGYPNGRFDTENNLPLLRKGYVASLPHLNFNGLRDFVIDAQVFPGSSGSPVFYVKNNRHVLGGVISQTMIRNNQLQRVVETTVGIQEVIGLGIVVKADALKDFLEQEVIPNLPT